MSGGIRGRAERLAKRYKKKSELLAQVQDILKTSGELNDLRQREIELSQLMHDKFQKLAEMIADEEDEPSG